MLVMNRFTNAIWNRRRGMTIEQALTDFFEKFEKSLDTTPIAAIDLKLSRLKAAMPAEYDRLAETPNLFATLDIWLDDIRQRNTELAIATFTSESGGELTEEEIRLIISAINTKGLFA